MIDFESIRSFPRCPYCQSSALTVVDVGSGMVCESCGRQYPMSLGRPVLLRPDTDIIAHYVGAKDLQHA